MSSFTRFFKYGAPILVLVVGGSFGLKEITTLKYQYGRQYSSKYIKEEAKARGIEVNENVTLESEFEKIQKMDTTNWVNKRGPRPWEKDNKLYQEAIERKKKLELKKLQEGTP